MNERDYTKYVGAKVRVTYRGITVEGWALPSTGRTTMYLGPEPSSDETAIRMAADYIGHVEVLVRAAPTDTYPPGTVVRWDRPRNGVSQSHRYGVAVKQSNGHWHDQGVFVTWATLINKRPLTVLTETTVLS
jgi:hypothetical protein